MDYARRRFLKPLHGRRLGVTQLRREDLEFNETRQTNPRLFRDILVFSWCCASSVRYRRITSVSSTHPGAAEPLLWIMNLAYLDFNEAEKVQHT
jgi:hypothetical protein